MMRTRGRILVSAAAGARGAAPPPPARPGGGGAEGAGEGSLAPAAGAGPGGSGQARRRQDLDPGDEREPAAATGRVRGELLAEPDPLAESVPGALPRHRHAWLRRPRGARVHDRD